MSWCPPHHTPAEQDNQRWRLRKILQRNPAQSELLPPLTYINLHLSPTLKHPLEEPEGPWCCPYGSDEEVGSLVAELPLSHCCLMQLAGLPSLFLYLDPQRKASGQSDLPLGDSKRSNEEAFAKPPTPTCLSSEGELPSKLLRRPVWASEGVLETSLLCGVWLSFEYSACLVSNFLFLRKSFSLINLCISMCCSFFLCVLNWEFSQPPIVNLILQTSGALSGPGWN